MLTCKEITERVTDYVERELTWRDRLQYWMHLAICAACRQYVAQMQTTVAVLTRLGADVRTAHPPLDPVLRDALRAVRDEASSQ